MCCGSVQQHLLSPRMRGHCFELVPCRLNQREGEGIMPLKGKKGDQKVGGVAGEDQGRKALGSS